MPHRNGLGHFTGKHILFVEDSYFLSEETRRKLQDAGTLVVGPVTCTEKALALIRDGPVDGAIIDINLDVKLIFPLAEKLENLGIPYVFAIADNPAALPKDFAGYILSETSGDLEEIARGLFGSRFA